MGNNVAQYDKKRETGVPISLYAKKTDWKYSLVPSRAFSSQERAPKRRCSSHTFRYGYLVTT